MRRGGGGGVARLRKSRRWAYAQGEGRRPVERLDWGGFEVRGETMRPIQSPELVDCATA